MNKSLKKNNIKKNQLFKKIPSREFVINFLKLFIPNGFDVYYDFYRDDINRKQVYTKLKLPYFINNLKGYYLPCKYKKYFEKLDNKKLITILRQLLKIYGYNIKSKEKYKNGKKYLMYYLKKNHEIPNKKKKTNILYFD